MLSIQACKTILEKHGKKYTHDKVNIIRSVLTKLAEVDYKNFQKLSKHEKDSGNIHTSIDR